MVEKDWREDGRGRDGRKRRGKVKWPGTATPGDPEGCLPGWCLRKSPGKPGGVE